MAKEVKPIVPLEKFEELHMGCPAEGCPNVRNSATAELKWYGSKCRGVIYISQLGNLCCEHHMKGELCVYGRMCSFGFDCGLRTDESPHSDGLSPFRSADRSSFSHALGYGIAFRYMASTDLEWASRLLRAITEQYEKREIKKQA